MIRISFRLWSVVARPEDVVGAESAALPEEKLVIEDAVRSHAWIFDALGELVAATPGTPRRPQREDVRRDVDGNCLPNAVRRGAAPSTPKWRPGGCADPGAPRVATEVAAKTRVLAILKPTLRSKWAFEPGHSAEGGTRTPTPLRAPAPKAGVSAVS